MFIKYHSPSNDYQCHKEQAEEYHGPGRNNRPNSAAFPEMVTRLVALADCSSPPTEAPWVFSLCVAFHLERLDLESKNVQDEAFVVTVVFVSVRSSV